MLSDSSLRGAATAPSAAALGHNARVNLRFLFDRFSLALIATVAAASLWPAHGSTALWLDRLTTAGIALLFFLHGARLPREAVVAGLRHWRLHALVLASTFALFPLLGLALEPLSGALITPAFWRLMLLLLSQFSVPALTRVNPPSTVT